MEKVKLLSSLPLTSAPSPVTLLPLPLALAGALLLPVLSYVTVLVFIAAFTLFERKTMGLFQRREGPDRLGLEGFGQPFADGLKLVLKETLLPRQTPAPSIFYLAPLLSLTISLALWLLMPLSSAGALVTSPLSLLLLLALSSLGSYGVIYSGWASNNKYALLGSLRAVAQFISYEIILSLLFLPFVAAVGSLNLWAVVTFAEGRGTFGYLLPLALIFAIAMLAETNRTPFDLPEAEAELVSGFNVEYSSLLFAFFFLAEYGSMGLMATLFVALFGGGWTLAGSTGLSLVGPGTALAQCLIFAAKGLLLCLVFVFVRASLPRQRFDQLIALCWKYLFPLSLTLVLWSLALYSLASRWLRGAELLSLAQESSALGMTTGLSPTLQGVLWSVTFGAVFYLLSGLFGGKGEGNSGTSPEEVPGPLPALRTADLGVFSHHLQIRANTLSLAEVVARASVYPSQFSRFVKDFVLVLADQNRLPLGRIPTNLHGYAIELWVDPRVGVCAQAVRTLAGRLLPVTESMPLEQVVALLHPAVPSYGVHGLAMTIFGGLLTLHLERIRPRLGRN